MRLMKQGLVIGKFMPLHTGHLRLIDFASAHCDELIILLSAKTTEPIPGRLRLAWLQQTYGNCSNIRIDFTEKNLPHAEQSCRTVSRAWARFLAARYPGVKTIFSSEEYGNYLAEYMQISHLAFDPVRRQVPVSARQIRRSPSRYWEYIPPAVRDYYRKSICVYGPESTGKSTLAVNLARHFNTAYVPEAAREILGDRHVVYEDIPVIAEQHARAICSQLQEARRFLFCDTDLITTRIYCLHYFHRLPEFPPWVARANSFDLYLFCDIDVPWVADPQRDQEHRREYFRQWFLDELEKRKLHYVIINGSWENRLETSIQAVQKRWDLSGTAESTETAIDN